MMFIAIFKNSQEHFQADTLNQLYEKIMDAGCEKEQFYYYELPEPFEVEVQVVRKQTIIRKEK